MQDKWNTDVGAAKTYGLVMVTVHISKYGHVVTMGCWDSSWSGQTWVYVDQRVPVGTIPLAWQYTPRPYIGVAA